MKRTLSVMVLLAGLVVGPGYLAYCYMLSGKSLGTYTVFKQEVHHVRAMGVTATSSKNAEWNTPLSLDLSPDMNPLRFSASAHYVSPTGPTGKSTRYVATLMKDEEPLWEETFSISAKQDEKRKKGISIGTSTDRVNKAIKTFSVHEPGAYELNVVQKGEDDITVVDLDIEVRRNVAIPKVTVAVSGFVLLIVGGTMSVLAQRRKKA